MKLPGGDQTNNKRFLIEISTHDSAALLAFLSRSMNVKLSVNYFYCTVSIHKMDVFSVCAAYLSYAMNIIPGLIKLYFLREQQDMKNYMRAAKHY